MSLVKSDADIKILKEGGKRLSGVLKEVEISVTPGIKTSELDGMAKDLIEKLGDRPSFLNYTPSSARAPFPASLCVSINNEVVHGIPGNRALLEGDIVGLDLGLEHKGLYVDMAVTVPVGSVSAREKKLIDDTKKALNKGIKVARSGKKVGAISSAIENFASSEGYGIVRDLGGHGLGYSVHDEPFIPNFGSDNSGPTLERGMVIALEPMLTLGGGDIIVSEDGFTVKTKDKSKSAHFEHTILITDKGCEILTQ
jgi:methionyl aminopeptidase